MHLVFFSVVDFLQAGTLAQKVKAYEKGACMSKESTVNGSIRFQGTFLSALSKSPWPSQSQMLSAHHEIFSKE